MRKLIVVFFIFFALSVTNLSTAFSASRIKDIVYFEGIRENTLVGYGIVMGLNGTGDNLQNTPFTEQGLQEFLSRLGINTSGTALKTKNVAAVMITANLPPFARSGTRFDVSVSTMGDAKSVEGGVLVATPLLAADGQVYAVAQGQVVIGGFHATGASGSSINKGIPTSGYIPNGALVEKEVDFKLSEMKKINLALRNPDISTARRIAESINDVVGEDAAIPLDPGTVKLTVPEIYGTNVVGLLADIEQVIVEPDQIAKVVIDEASGTIVMGEDVKIDTIAVAQGNLLVTVSESTEVSQPGAFSADSATSVSTTVTDIAVTDDPYTGLAIVRQAANLRDLVAGLNALGVSTRDLINILQTIKVSGALHADIETR